MALPIIVGYLLACYLYWPAMKIIGLVVEGASFRFENPQCNFFIWFGWYVILSPLVVPLDVIYAPLHPRMGYVRYDSLFRLGPQVILLSWGSFALAAAASTAVMFGLSRAMSRRGEK